MKRARSRLRASCNASARSSATARRTRNAINAPISGAAFNLVAEVSRRKRIGDLQVEAPHGQRADMSPGEAEIDDFASKFLARKGSIPRDFEFEF